MPQLDQIGLIAAEVLRRYLRLLDSTRCGGRGLASAFFEAMGLPLEDARAARRTWLALLHVPLETAREMVYPETFPNSVYCRALGIRTQDELRACAAVVLHVRAGHPLLGRYDLPKPGAAHISPAQEGRKAILSALRELLMRRNELAFLAMATLAGAHGHGASRIGTAGYSHFARETLLFALLGSFAGTDLLDEMLAQIEGADDKAAGTDAAQGESAGNMHTPCSAVMAEVFFALRRDLDWLSRRRNQPDVDIPLSPNYVPEGGEETGELTEAIGPNAEAEQDGPAAGDLPAEQASPLVCVTTMADPEQEVKRLQQEIASLQRSLGEADASEATRDYLTARIERTRQRLSTAEHQVRQGQRSRPFVLVSDDVVLYEPILRAVVEAAEASDQRISCGGASTLVRHYFRLRFAAQLWSFCVEQSYPAKRRADLVQDLAMELDWTADPDTGNALEVFSKCQDKSRWGEAHNPAVDTLIAGVLRPQPGSEPSAAFERSATVVKDCLARLESLPGGFPSRAAGLDSVSGLIEALAQVLQWQAGAGLSAGAAAAAVEVETQRLREALLSLLLTRLPETVDVLLGELRPLLGETFEREPLSLGYLRRLMDLLESNWQASLTVPKIPSLHDLDHGSRRELLRLWVLRLLFGELCKDEHRGLIERLNRQESISTDKVQGFFTQQYAKHQEQGPRTWSREEWEYLAYRLARSGASPHYANLYARVVARSPLPPPSRLSRLYRSLIDENGFLDTLETGVRRCLSGPGSSPP